MKYLPLMILVPDFVPTKYMYRTSILIEILVLLDSMSVRLFFEKVSDCGYGMVR